MEIVFRSLAIFFFLWVVTRAVGRSSLGELSTFPLLLYVTMGDLVHLHAEHLVQLDRVALEAEPRPGHVERPHPRTLRPDLGDRLVPVGTEVGAPPGECPRVVLAEVLLVPHLETVVLHRGDDEAD